ncbi:hypothetical protein [Noviherbaspirillum saxi]|uniref:Uncharacterized protein n=1 Tax=Noviherbaspirillum saxi TaxID=2320863 RepID=A0A3A3FKZ7_9BURK|nr:hypothetical protein [Noviherbaspirillum saxi]RJF96163.1 hypothetical protein D3871_22825 [Noviherbaspirillum saxi]
MHTKPFVKPSQGNDSPATLKEIMTEPPMDAQQHQHLMYARVLRRRVIEDRAAERKLAESDLW